jgi:BRCA1-associated protein
MLLQIVETRPDKGGIVQSYVHRLIQNRSDGKLVELPSATSLTGSKRISTGLHFDRLNASAVVKGLGPSVSDEKKMSQLEDITLEYSYLVSEQLEQQKANHDAEMRIIQRQLKDAQQKAAEGEQWRKRFISAEDTQKSFEQKVLPGLEQAKGQAEQKFEKVNRTWPVGRVEIS